MQNTGFLLAALSFLIGVNADPAIKAVVLFGRHGDRTSKVTPNTHLTELGRAQGYENGEFFSQRYLNSSSEYYISGLSQEFSSTKYYSISTDGAALYNTALAFLQGLFPSSDSNFAVTQTLANGSVISDPLDGIQMPVLYTESSAEVDYFHLDAATNCPSYTVASNKYYQSEEFKLINSSTYNFYQNFSRIFDGVLAPTQLSYKNAYNVFDYINVNYIHNETVHNNITTEELYQLRTLADRFSAKLIYNVSEPATYVDGITILPYIQSLLEMQVNSTTASSSPKLFYFTGSYPKTQAVWAAMGLLDGENSPFMAIPDYAATSVWELWYDNSTNEYQVEFLFKNTTVSDETESLSAHPMFVSGNTTVTDSNRRMSWTDFNNKVNSLSPQVINTLSDWCSFCSATSSLCVAPRNLQSLQNQVKSLQNKYNLTPAQAGGVGAGVTIGVFLILGTILFVLSRFFRRSNSKIPAVFSNQHKNSREASEKSSVDSAA